MMADDALHCNPPDSMMSSHANRDGVGDRRACGVYRLMRPSDGARRSCSI